MCIHNVVMLENWFKIFVYALIVKGYLKNKGFYIPVNMEEQISSFSEVVLNKQND